jgi:hypothetical protein
MSNAELRCRLGAFASEASADAAPFNLFYRKTQDMSNFSLSKLSRRRAERKTGRLRSPTPTMEFLESRALLSGAATTQIWGAHQSKAAPSILTPHRAETNTSLAMNDPAHSMFADDGGSSNCHKTDSNDHYLHHVAPREHARRHLTHTLLRHAVAK